METLDDVATEFVVTTKVALLAPAGTVRLDVNVATAELLLDRLTTTPPAGAAELRVTEPWEDEPPIRVVGVRLTLLRVTASGATLSVADFVTPPYDAEIVTLVGAATEY